MTPMDFGGLRALARAPSRAAHHPVMFPKLMPSSSDGDFESAMRLVSLLQALGKDRATPSDPMTSEASIAPAPQEPVAEEEPVDDIPQGYFSRNKMVESGGKADAVNPLSGAGGLYQFIEPTWRGLMREAPELGLTPEGRIGTTREAQEQQERAMRYFTRQNADTLRGAGINPTSGRLYALHFAGPTEGMDLVSGPDRDLKAIFPQSYFDANPFLKNYRTGRELLAEFDRRFS